MNKKIALITGATSGIGEACARKFAEGGYNLILTGRNEQKLNSLTQQLRQTGAAITPLVFDVRHAEEARKAWEGLDDAWQQVDVLINNAGLALGLEKEYEGNPTDW